MTHIKISASGVAEFIAASPASKANRLRPFKYRDRGEGAGRSSYYQKAVSTIREYHRAGNDHSVIRHALEDLMVVAHDKSLHTLVRVKARRNSEALLAYEKRYGRRKFRVLPNHRISLPMGDVTITVQPDLWVEEEGTQVLIKIGVAKRKSQKYVDLLLHVIRKAAIATGYRVRARNVVYLDIATGKEVVSQLPLPYFNRTLTSARHEIAQLWPSVTLTP